MSRLTKMDEALITLRDGMTWIRQEMEKLQAENKALKERRAALESQIMDMAIRPEPPADWWDKVIFVFEEDDEEEPKAG